MLRTCCKSTLAVAKLSVLISAAGRLLTCGSVPRLVHTLFLHLKEPAGQSWHWPRQQLMPWGHTLWQPPQLRGSTCSKKGGSKHEHQEKAAQVWGSASVCEQEARMMESYAVQ